jgi:hypothetical protein
MMLQSNDIAGASLQDFEAWKDLLRLCGGCRAEGLSTYMGYGSNAHRVGRAQSDIRLDGPEHYLVLLSTFRKISDNPEWPGCAARRAILHVVDAR